MNALNTVFLTNVNCDAKDRNNKRSYMIFPILRAKLMPEGVSGGKGVGWKNRERNRDF